MWKYAGKGSDRSPEAEIFVNPKMVRLHDWLRLVDDKESTRRLGREWNLLMGKQLRRTTILSF
jgi:hypothetical protein